MSCFLVVFYVILHISRGKVHFLASQEEVPEVLFWSHVSFSASMSFSKSAFFVTKNTFLLLSDPRSAEEPHEAIF